MNNTTTIEQLKAMRFSAMARELENQMNDPAGYRELSFDDRLGLLVGKKNCKCSFKCDFSSAGNAGGYSFAASFT